MPVIEIFDNETLKDTVINATKDLLVVVCFSSANCGACRQTTLRIDKLCQELENCLFIKVEVKESDEFVDAYCIKGVPAFILCRNGQVLEQFQGGNADYLQKSVEKHCNRN